jgi:phosphoribosylglycinamide formyltransferase-1
MIGIITYDIPHKKTQDVLFRLKALGYNDVECIAFPFIKRKKFTPLVQHRITDLIDVAPDILCKRLGYSYTKGIDFERYDKILIGGANILSKEIIGKYEIINSHPGYMPYVRGLDSLKWAILKGFPIGVTTHVINEKIDEGLIIEQRFISVDYFDTIHSLGQKTYAIEVEMLIDAIHNTDRAVPEWGTYPPNRRMPHRLEVKMLEKLKLLQIG